MTIPIAGASSDMMCTSGKRRAAIRRSEALAGIDYIEVYPDRVTLCVHFFGQVPEGLNAEHMVVEGGERIRDIVVLHAEFHQDEENDENCLRVMVDRPGDFSTYWLCLRKPDDNSAGSDSRSLLGIDPRYACAPFSFRTDCQPALDCRPEACPDPPRKPSPLINYLAKDYQSFRRLLLDRLAVTLPDWRERHAPDLGITLVELLAYVADQLSYYQDAVATEAYLRTARRRISVKRHVRLIDYHMHEGCNARAWITISADTDENLSLDDVVFGAPVRGSSAVPGGVVSLEELRAKTTPSTIFEPIPLDPSNPILRIRAAHSAIHFHRWGEDICCLLSGAVRATLVDQVQRPLVTQSQGSAENSEDLSEGADAPLERILELKRGDVLIIEETAGPATGHSADADPMHRHAVRLIADPVPGVDPLDGTLILDIEWGPEDALPFALCLSARTPPPDCKLIETAIARANTVLVDAGWSQTEADPSWEVKSERTSARCLCDGLISEITYAASFFEIALANGPLTHATPVAAASAGAEALLHQEPRSALPIITLEEHLAGADKDTAPLQWSTVTDLLRSSDEDRHFALEVDDSGLAHIRFDQKRLHAAIGSRFTACYRLGNGLESNVGPDSIVLMARRSGTLSGSGLRPRNPLSAKGGTDPESVADVRLKAPDAYSRLLARAVTGADYAELAGRDPRLQGAYAELVWTGSWYEASVAVDPRASTTDLVGLSEDLMKDLAPMRRIGHDLRIVRTRSVPLVVALDVCLNPGYARGDVERSLRMILSNRTLPDGTLGLFHPDALGFGQDVIASRLVAAVQLTEGVRSVGLLRFERMDDGKDHRTDGLIPIASDEIARLDNDPNYPDRGLLTIQVKGG